MCSGCFSLERHRLLIDFIEQEMCEILTGDCRILHVAAEACISDRIERNPNASYETIDNMSQFIFGLERKPKRVMDVIDLDYQDETFDYIICNHVLEHVDDDKKAMRELYRVLKVGGAGLINVPINRNSDETLEDRTLSPLERRHQYGQADHLRYYGIVDFARGLESVGFEVTVRKFGRETSLDPIRNGIMVHEEIVVCRKLSATSNSQMLFSSPTPKITGTSVDVQG